MALTLVRHRFSVDEYEQMIEHGILTENARVELIRGEIIEKMAIGDPHAACVKRTNRLLGLTFGSRSLISVQDPIRLIDSEPEPDVALLLPRDDFYLSGKPRPADILLLIEVSDSSLEYDRLVKLPMYAEAGIAEYLDRQPRGRMPGGLSSTHGRRRLQRNPDPATGPGR